MGRAFVAAVSLAVGVLGCSVGGPDAVAPALPGAERGELPVPPSVGSFDEIRARWLRNLNELDTPVGQLCWAATEAPRRHMLALADRLEAWVDAGVGPDDGQESDGEEPLLTAAEVDELMTEILATVDLRGLAASPGLSGESRRFAGALFDLYAALQRSAAEGTVDLDRLGELEQLSGLAGFLAESDGCSGQL